MADQLTVYRTFISSANDVAAERQLAREVIQQINRTCSDTLAASVMVHAWEDQPPLTPHLPEEKIQDIINREVEKAHFFVLISYKRYGTAESGHTKSNTERELETILKRYETNPEIRILAYFRDIPPEIDPGPQLTQVTQFRERLEKIPIRYRTYKDPIEFKDAFTHDMYNVILRMRLSPFKRNALARFWKIGIANRQVYPRIAILFPAVARQFTSPNDEGLWLRRLEPNVYYEDFRAIYKIQKTLSIIGSHSYKTFFNNNLPADLRYMNRIWVCFPRSRTAIKEVNNYAARARFSFDFRTAVASKVSWRSKGGEELTIASPLAEYILQQRGKAVLSGECTAQLRNIICKDFGIIARFCNDKSSGVTDEGFLYDYYFAGIRGLGTWGAAWYIDRKSKMLLNYPEKEDIQILVEVRYENGGIADVVEVSEESREYFLEQTDREYIREQIQLFTEK